MYAYSTISILSTKENVNVSQALRQDVLFNFLGVIASDSITLQLLKFVGLSYLLLILINSVKLNYKTGPIAFIANNIAPKRQVSILNHFRQPHNVRGILDIYFKW